MTSRNSALKESSLARPPHRVLYFILKKAPYNGVTRLHRTKRTHFSECGMLGNLLSFYYPQPSDTCRTLPSDSRLYIYVVRYPQAVDYIYMP